MKRTAAALVLATAFALSACGDNDADHLPEGGGSAPTTDEVFHETPVAEETAPETGVFGSYEDPLPAGTPLTLNEWEITISSDVTTGKGAAGAPDDEINLVAEASALRIGHGGSSLFVDLMISVIGGDGIEYSGTAVCDDGIDDYADAYPGAELVGNFCPTLPASAVDGAVWKIAQPEGDNAFVAVGEVR